MFGLDPNEVVHHKIGGVPSSVFKNSRNALSQVRPVALAGKIGEEALVFGGKAPPGVYQTPKLPENLPEGDNKEKQLPVKEEVEAPAISENPFAGRNVRIAGKGRK